MSDDEHFGYFTDKAINTFFHNWKSDNSPVFLFFYGDSLLPMVTMQVSSDIVDS